MEELRKNMLYGRLKRISDMAREICCELTDMADCYYEDGEVYNTLSNLALDANELSYSLENKTLLSDTTTCLLNGDRVEIERNDWVGLIQDDGTLDEGYITEIISDDETDITLSITDTTTDEPKGKYHLNNVIKWSWFHNLLQKEWNKFVKTLAAQEKSVSLLQQNGIFEIKITDGDSKVIYHKCGLCITDINKNLFNEMKET